MGLRRVLATVYLALCLNEGRRHEHNASGNDYAFPRSRTPRQTGDNRRFPAAETCPPMSRTSLTRFLIQEQHAGRINADLRQLIAVVARACTSISIAVSKGALGGVLGDAGTGNVQGEAQKKLDVISNEILLEANAWVATLPPAPRRKWTTASRCRTSIRAVISCCCSTPRWQLQHRRQRLRRHHLLGAALPDQRRAAGR